MKRELYLDPDTSLLRGIEQADGPIVLRFINALQAMREPATYSCQDVDRRAEARAALRQLREIGNTPIARKTSA